MKVPHPSPLLRSRIHSLLATATAVAPLLLVLEAQAAAPPSDELQEIIVEGDRLNVMQNVPVESVFGFGKSVEETPRSVTTINNELLSKTLITEIDDLVALTPGSFTQSFFGVAGSLDVRGSPGENYFRGVKRIDNPGNYPTPIGASDRIDIVRGPASPIYGPSKIGGYLNFVPKSARASDGKFVSEPKGELGITAGSFDKKVLHAEVGGPAMLMGKEAGFYVYGESENSGSYYENSSTEQSIFQASFDLTLSDTWRTEFGGMYQYFKGNQVAGWNRVTQALIDNGTYITGSPASLDTNGDGLLSAAESETAGISTGPNFYSPGLPFATAAVVAATINGNPNMALQNPGTTQLQGSQVLVQEDDNLEDDIITLYFDLIGEYASGLKITNKTFFESLKNNNENAYGFSQFADTYAIEDQLNFMKAADFGSAVKANFQAGASVRYQNFEHGDDFDYEFFDRRDISVGGKISTPVDRRTMATRGQDIYSDHAKGDFTDWGASFLADFMFYDKLNLLVGARYDYVDMQSTSQSDARINVKPDFLGGLLANFGKLDFADTDDAVSWSASLSYDLPFGIRPYVTIARQSSMLLGQGGQIDPGQIGNGVVLSPSDLDEFGIKASLLDNRMFVAVSYYKQTRTDTSSQDIVTNAATEAKGYEAELRYVPTNWLTIAGVYSNIKVVNLTSLADGDQFSFLGGEDLIALLGVAPENAYGGAVAGDLATTDGRKGGIPENIYSLTFLLGLDAWVQGLSGTLSVTSVDSVYSGYSKSVKLPSYTLFNAGLRYESGSWSTGVTVKNLTDEQYFRSNFPDLFGSSVVLPELPRTYLFSVDYKF